MLLDPTGHAEILRHPCRKRLDLDQEVRARSERSTLLSIPGAPPRQRLDLCARHRTRDRADPAGFRPVYGAFSPARWSRTAVSMPFFAKKIGRDGRSLCNQSRQTRSFF
jgi:hypothetical protein